MLNPRFADVGALPGEAAHWTISASTSLEELAGFGSAPEEAFEGFERWTALLDQLSAVQVSLAFFDRDGFESFERGWGNSAYLRELPTGRVVTAAFGGRAVEDCEGGWLSVPFARVWADVTPDAAIFDGEPVEDFEEAWRSNEAWLHDWPSAAAVPARFDAQAAQAEAFSGRWSATTTL